MKMILLRILPLVFFLQACDAQKHQVASERAIPIKHVIQIVHEVDDGLAFNKSTGQVAKMIRVEELGECKNRLKDVDCYDAIKVIDNIEVSIHFQTYEDPNILDQGTVSVKCKSTEFVTNDKKIKELAEKYISGFIVRFIEIESIRKN